MTYDDSDGSPDDEVFMEDNEWRSAVRRWWDRNARWIVGLGIAVLVFVFWYYVCSLIAWAW